MSRSQMMHIEKRCALIKSRQCKEIESRDMEYLPKILESGNLEPQSIKISESLKIPNVSRYN